MLRLLDGIRDILINATDSSILILFALSTILFVLLIAYWLYNRRRFQKLSHQIPAGVVKNYLDSIIQNSSALKSSLFRGGGLEVGKGAPSVVSTTDFPKGGVEINNGNDEVLAQKNAEVAQLKSEIAIKNATIKDLEKKLTTLRGLTEQDKLKKLLREHEALKQENERLRQMSEEKKEAPSKKPPSMAIKEPADKEDEGENSEELLKEFEKMLN